MSLIPVQDKSEELLPKIKDYIAQSVDTFNATKLEASDSEPKGFWGGNNIYLMMQHIKDFSTSHMPETNSSSMNEFIEELCSRFNKVKQAIISIPHIFNPIDQSAENQLRDQNDRKQQATDKIDSFIQEIRAMVPTHTTLP